MASAWFQRSARPEHICSPPSLLLRDYIIMNKLQPLNVLLRALAQRRAKISLPCKELSQSEDTFLTFVVSGCMKIKKEKSKKKTA